MTCIVLISGTLPDFRWLKWDATPNTYPSSLDLENGSYTLVNPVQYETVHIKGKYGVKVKIQNVTPKDLGLYTCYVSNHLGSDYRSAFLSERTKRWKGSGGKIRLKWNLYERTAFGTCQLLKLVSSVWSGQYWLDSIHAIHYSDYSQFIILITVIKLLKLKPHRWLYSFNETCFCRL